MGKACAGVTDNRWTDDIGSVAACGYRFDQYAMYCYQQSAKKRIDRASSELPPGPEGARVCEGP